MRTHSIAKATPKSAGGTDESYFKARDQEHKPGKEAVARCIVEDYLSEGDSILLDAGSSLYPIAEMIAQKTQSMPGRTHFTIMTHNYKAFEVLVKVPRAANLNIVLAGGRYDQDLNALFGNQTVTAYEDFFAAGRAVGDKWYGCRNWSILSWQHRRTSC